MNILIIGAGGIGSYTIAHLDKLIQHEQIKDVNIECADDDTVELKNILYQNFTPEDIDDYKTDALAFRYVNIDLYTNKRIGLDDLNHYNLVVLCADNNIIRRHAYQNFIKHQVPFIDSRSNGTTVGIYSSNTPEYLSTIDDTDESSSCQHPWQIAKNEIELGNVIISSILAQSILSYCRTKRLPIDYMHNF